MTTFLVIFGVLWFLNLIFWVTVLLLNNSKPILKKEDIKTFALVACGFPYIWIVFLINWWADYTDKPL